MPSKKNPPVEQAEETEEQTAPVEAVEEEKKPVIEFVTDDEPAATDVIEIDDDEEVEPEEPAQPVEKNGVDRLNDRLASFFRPGTATCSMFGAGCGIVAAVLCVTVGFWPTLLGGCLAGAGVWLSRVGSGKPGLISRIQKLFQDD